MNSNDEEVNYLAFEQSDEENELPSTHDALKKIESAWLNEKFAPEILPNKMDIVESIIDQIDYFDGQLGTLNKNDIRYDIHSMELSRIRFVISSYLRIRLEKIEKYVYHILDEEEKRSENKYLTSNELHFALEYKNSIEKLFGDLALRHMPPICNSQPKDAAKPNLDARVIVKVKKFVSNILVADYDVDLKVGSQHILPYNAIKNYVKDGSVQLI